MNRNIAVDGPAGAGKSTVAKEVAKRLGLVYVDTGAMYRAMAIYFLEQGLSPEDQEGITRACRDAEVSIAYENGVQQVYLGGKNVTGRIREEAVGNMASRSSVYPAVRAKMTQLQQALAERTPVIMDGRDIGTVVLPQAALKIYLTASAEERARRRFRELAEKGEACELADIERDIRERDRRDMNRETAPLRQAEDAVLVDATEMDIEQVVGRILELYRERVPEATQGQAGRKGE